MKKLFKTGFIALMAALALSACSKEEKLAELNVELSMPAGFSAQFNGEVVISSKDLGKTYTATAENGVVAFEKIYPGVYELQAHQSMSKQDAQKAAPELGIQNDIIINGVANQIVIELDVENQAKVNTTWSVESKLVISRIFCNGTKYNGGSRNNGPKFYEIFNNSAEVQYLDGLCLAAVHGMTTGKGKCELYEKYQNEATYVSRIAKLPGNHGTDKKIALEPGKSFVIAWNARNFIVTEEGAEKCTMNVDLSTADYEMFDNGNTRLGFVDNVNVPNMIDTYDCAPGGQTFVDMHQAMVIFFATDDEIQTWETGVDETSYFTASQKAMKAKRVANELILDAVETWKNGTKQFKRVPDALDAKGIASDDHIGIVFDRKVQYIAGDRIVLQDTNNSSNDFVAVGSRNAENFDGSHLVIRDYSKPEIQPAN